MKIGMTKISNMRPEFVDVIPDIVRDGVLYISQEYSTAVHKCCCGCGQEVVTPLGPTDWTVTTQRGVPSVFPSIGNWSFECKSHYWIDQGRILWAEQWSEAQIRSGRMHDQRTKQSRYEHADQLRRKKPGFWSRLWRFLTG